MFSGIDGSPMLVPLDKFVENHTTDATSVGQQLVAALPTPYLRAERSGEQFASDLVRIVSLNGTPKMSHEFEQQLPTRAPELDDDLRDRKAKKDKEHFLGFDDQGMLDANPSGDNTRQSGHEQGKPVPNALMSQIEDGDSPSNEERTVTQQDFVTGTIQFEFPSEFTERLITVEMTPLMTPTSKKPELYRCKFKAVWLGTEILAHASEGDRRRLSEVTLEEVVNLSTRLCEFVFGRTRGMVLGDASFEPLDMPGSAEITRTSSTAEPFWNIWLADRGSYEAEGCTDTVLTTIPSISRAVMRLG